MLRAGTLQLSNLIIVSYVPLNNESLSPPVCNCTHRALMSTIPKAQVPHVSGEIVQPLKEVADLERNHVLLPTPNDLPQSDTPAPGGWDCSSGVPGLHTLTAHIN